MSELPPLLVVDDDADDRELLRLVLRGACGEVTLEEAPDAAALARQMTRGRFGLVLTESVLPWIHGEDVLRLVRDLRPGVPVVVLTRRPLQEVAAELIHLAPDALVPKTSAGWTELAPALHRALEAARGAPGAGRTAAATPPAPPATSDAEEMAYVVAHDLRGPLTQVVRALDLLQEPARNGDGGGGDMMALARRGARRLQTLLDGVESYARIAADGKPSPVDLEAVLARVLARLADERAASGAEVTHEPLPTLVASEPQMEQLLQNLLANAFKFRGERPARVHIGCTLDGEGWHLAVRDQGIGLDPRHAERIFGLFQRLHTEDEVPGSGIGLALCRRIVQRHGGRIWVDSAPGAGATFHVSLPRAPAARPSPET